MMLNARAINASPLNGVKRLPVWGAGESAVITIGMEVSTDAAQMMVLGRGDALTGFTASMDLLATRRASSNAVLGVNTSFVPSVLRNAKGAAHITLKTSLFYERAKYFDGALLIELRANAHIGIMFGAGEAVMLPMTTELDPTRAKTGDGEAAMSFTPAMAPSALRRCKSAVDTHLRIHAGLDPATKVGGIKYITAGMTARLPLRLEDHGVTRLSQLGTARADLRMTLKPSSVRALRGVHVRNIDAKLTGSVSRMASGLAQVITTKAKLDGDTVVRGGGSAVLKFGAATSTGYVIKHVTDEAVDVMPVLHLEDSARAVRRGRGIGEMALLAAGGAGYLTLMLDGELPVTLEADGVFSTIHTSGGESAALIRLSMEGSGEVLVPFEAPSLTIDTIAECEMNRIRIPEFHPMVLSTVTELDGDAAAVGEGTKELTLLGSMTGTRYALGDAEGSFLGLLNGSLEGLCYAVGEGEASMELSAELRGVCLVRGAADATFDDIFDGDGTLRRHQTGDGEAVFSYRAECDGIRALTGGGSAYMELLTSSDAYTNIDSADTDAQTFIRPAEQRVFERPAEQRIFMRADA